MARLPDTIPDDELLDAARVGDRDAVEMLLRRHHDRILAVCRRMCADPSDAEDAAQESLIAIVRGLPNFDGRSQLSTWIYRVTSNCCLDELRRHRRRPLPIDDAEMPARASTDPLPDEEAEAGATRAVLASALGQLPEEFRVPLVLRDVADLDYAAIAEVLDIPPGTVRSRIARARARLAEAVAPLAPPSHGNQTDGTDVQRDSAAQSNELLRANPDHMNDGPR